ncbi:hypothetical protein PHMEG_00033740 [Phytophthora megakarya]|uniref:Uncharacterized protein n=1 Tax=Phytophthora megakarya TaxID=4795 RepID=A0A225UT90_9STRA|nr:hypothetical protein PHMEG_00033740 [Phytophthora megakarya]
MEVLDGIRKDVIKQKEEETFNLFLACRGPSRRALFEATFNDLMGLTAGKHKPYIAQVTVWDAKTKKGVASKPSIVFRAGGVYAFRQIDVVGFYADIPTTRKRGSPRKSPPKKKVKTKQRERASCGVELDVSNSNNEEERNRGYDEGDGDVAMEPEYKVDNGDISVRTRSNAAVSA